MSYIHRSQELEFLVALEMRNIDELRNEFIAVSDPKSARYGQYYDLRRLNQEFSLKLSDREAVVRFFASIPGARVEGHDSLGDFLNVRAPIKSIEESLATKVEFFIPANTQRSANRGSYRAVYDLAIPSNIEKHIAFTSLTAPIHNLTPRLTKSDFNAESSAASIGVVQGNEEVLVQFTASCGDGSSNNVNPPCSNLSPGYQPLFTIQVTEQSLDTSDTADLTTEPLTFVVEASDVYCYNSETVLPCDGTINDGTCLCLAKVSLLCSFRM
jgi:subtilase family serine protease